MSTSDNGDNDVGNAGNGNGHSNDGDGDSPMLSIRQNGDVNGSGNDAIRTRIRTQQGLQRIEESVPLTSRAGLELLQRIWDFMTEFSDDVLSKLDAGNLLVSDLIAERQGNARHAANGHRRPIGSVLRNAVLDFFRGDQQLLLRQLPQLTSTEEETLQSRRTDRHQMSGALTDLTNHKSIQKVYHRFNTDFVAFGPVFREDADDAISEQAGSEGDDWDLFLKNISEKGYKIAQMLRLIDCINPILEESCLRMVLTTNSNPDIEMRDTRDSNRLILIGEAKWIEQLPATPPTAQLSKDLLEHGFATMLSRVTYGKSEVGEKDLNELAENLRNTLHVPDGNLQGTVIPPSRLSAKARDILTDQNDKDRDESYDNVRDAFLNGQINDDNALHLWVATMQACVKSIELKKKYAMVLSNKVVWFIHLQESDGNRGTIAISKGLSADGKCFTRDYIRYAVMVRGDEDTSEDEKSEENDGRDQDGGYQSGDEEDNDDGDRAMVSGKKQERHKEQNNGINSHSLSENDEVSKTTYQHDENEWKSNDGLDGSVLTTVTHSPSSHDTREYILLDKNDHNQKEKKRPTVYSENEYDACGSKKTAMINSPRCSIMTDQDQMRWQRALWSPVCRNADETAIDDLQHHGISPTTSSRESAPTAGASLFLKRSKIDASTNDNGDNTSWTLTKAEQDALLDIDEYGYIPYLSQIKTIHCTLGSGRCGKVKMIQFFGYQVAMKEFKLHLDNDKRDYYVVFEHERQMYIHTKSLWGTHVPALIFHNPWGSCPSLGIQLGEPIEEDDIEKWKQEDQDKLEETLEKLEELGLKQTETRGWNFVKLRKGDTEYVAVIDMESVNFIGNGE